MSQNLSSAAVVIGALRVKIHCVLYIFSQLSEDKRHHYEVIPEGEYVYMKQCYSLVPL